MRSYLTGHIRGFVMGAVFAALALGFSYSMPGIFTASDVSPEDDVTVVPTESPEPQPTEVDETEPEEGETEEGELEEPEGRTANHGSVVKVAAHCDVKGKPHGELVSSVARDKQATLADAEQACADAMAAQEAAGSSGPGGAGKSSAPGRAKKARGDEGPDDGGSKEDVAGDGSGESEAKAEPADAPSGHGRGKGKTK